MNINVRQAHNSTATGRLSPIVESGEIMFMSVARQRAKPGSDLSALRVAIGAQSFCFAFQCTTFFRSWLKRERPQRSNAFVERVHERRKPVWS
jgi:hypothetical protein